MGATAIRQRRAALSSFDDLAFDFLVPTHDVVITPGDARVETNLAVIRCFCRQRIVLAGLWQALQLAAALINRVADLLGAVS